MSAMMCVEPAEFNRLMTRLAGTRTVTRLGTVWPGTKLRLEAVGGATSLGNTVTYPLDVGSVTVTFSTMACQGLGDDDDENCDNESETTPPWGTLPTGAPTGTPNAPRVSSSRPKWAVWKRVPAG